jgi:hypothetical protein
MALATSAVVSGAELLDDYNYYRFHTGHVQNLRKSGAHIKSLAPTAERLAGLESMARWCAEHGYNPRRWLAVVFARSRWMYAPKFNQLVPQGKAARERLEGLYASAVVPLFRQRAREVVDADRGSSGASYDPNRDLSATVEAHKERHFRMGHSPAECMADPETLGFHHGSRWCRSCASQVACAHALVGRFGVGILLTRLEASQHQARA